MKEDNFESYKREVEGWVAFLGFFIVCGMMLYVANTLQLNEQVDPVVGRGCAIILVIAGTFWGIARGQILDSGILMSLSFGLLPSELSSQVTSPLEYQLVDTVNVTISICLLVFLTPKISDSLIGFSDLISGKLSARLWKRVRATS